MKKFIPIIFGLLVGSIVIYYLSRYVPSFLTNSINIEHSVVVKINPESECIRDIYISKCRSDIYLQDKKTGKEDHVVTVDDVLRNDSRVPSYRNGNIFLIRRTGNDVYPSEDWADELWVYGQDGGGRKLFSGKGFHYSANSEGSVIALVGFYSSGRYDIKTIKLIRDLDAQKISSHILDTGKCIVDKDVLSSMLFIGMNGWEGRDIVWGNLSGTLNAVGCFWSFDAKSGVFKYYPLPKVFGSMSLNVEKKLSTYTDHPVFLDAESNDAWLRTNPTYNLYLYNLKNQKSILIDTISSETKNSNFEGDWVDSSKLLYPSLNEKKTYLLVE